LATTTTVAYACYSFAGSLQAANPRFLEVIAPLQTGSSFLDAVVEGQGDTAAGLLRERRPCTEALLLHFSGGQRLPVTLLTSWAWDGDDLHLLGAPPVADLEQAQTALVELNQRVSDLARENVKKSAQLEKALDDLRRTQSMLVHREKMAALGQMTAGVAHELNNPLAYVKNNEYLIQRGVEDLLGLINLFGDGLDDLEVCSPDLFEQILTRLQEIDLPGLGERLPRLLAAVDDGVERASGLVAGLRTFSRLDEAEVKTVDLNESLRSVVEFTGFLMKENDIAFAADYGELPPVTCSPGQLNQAVMNVLVNAVQAAGPGGRVKMSTKSQGGEVLISVADDGPGVPAELRSRIFEPFYTTRAVGDGTGLGLSIAHAVVTGFGGSISVSDAPEGGALFTIRLPLESKDGP